MDDSYQPDLTGTSAVLDTRLSANSNFLSHISHLIREIYKHIRKYQRFLDLELYIKGKRSCFGGGFLKENQDCKRANEYRI